MEHLHLALLLILQSLARNSYICLWHAPDQKMGCCAGKPTRTLPIDGDEEDVPRVPFGKTGKRNSIMLNKERLARKSPPQQGIESNDIADTSLARTLSKNQRRGSIEAARVRIDSKRVKKDPFAAPPQ